MLNPISTLLSVVMLICWALMIVYLFGVVGQSVHGDAVVGYALAWFAALGLAVVVYSCAGGIIFQFAQQGAISRAMGWAMFGASAAAAGSAMFLIQDPKRIWPALILVLLPPAIVVALRLGSVPLYLTIVALSALPVLAAIGKIATDASDRAEGAKEMQQADAAWQRERRAENLEKIKAMPPDARVMDWYPLLDEESGVQAEAFEALRHVDRRQADMEDMLPYGIIRAMMLVPDLDLKATPQLCAAGKAFLKKHAENTRRGAQDPTPFDDAGTLEKIAPGIRWFKSHGCDCDAEIGALEDSVRSFLDSPARKRALELLKSIKH